ncbi:MAG: SulP family inorganic anion transporter [Anaerolineae bacterium]|nr:SulP family inorganic anion transporter [Anaerolineae bacterium]
MTDQSTVAPVNPFARIERPHGIGRWIPAIPALRTYQRAWLPRDLAAGLVLAAILVPVGMGYAEAAGLPAINGLYATIFPLLAYAIFGPSRILVLGPDSSLAAIIAATIVPLAAGNPDTLVALAGMLALLTGALCILAGLAHFGFITDLLSKPIRIGYLNGIALTVLVGQLPKILGFSSSGTGLIQEAASLVQGVAQGLTNPVTLAIGLACLAVILLFKRFLPKVPGVLVAVIGATVVVGALNLAVVAGVSVVGPLPQGLPSFEVPRVSLDDMGMLLMGAVAITLVSFADTSVLSRTFALRGGYQVDQNQEIVALGAANVASGLFQGFSISSSSSRTPVAEQAGAKTQLTGVVGALTVAALLVFAPALLQNLPNAALGAVVIAACISLVDIQGVVRLYHLRRAEFVFSIVCFLGVALTGVIQGIGIAILLALFDFIWRAWRPYDAVLGREEGIAGYVDVSRHPKAVQIPGLLLYRWTAPLFFANADLFYEQVREAIGSAPTPVKWIVISAEPVTDVDITAADTLSQLDDDLQRAGIELSFAEMKGPVKDRLKKYELFSKLGDHLFFRTLDEAVEAYRKAHPEG